MKNCAENFDAQQKDSISRFGALESLRMMVDEDAKEERIGDVDIYHVLISNITFHEAQLKKQYLVKRSSNIFSFMHLLQIPSYKICIYDQTRSVIPCLWHAKSSYTAEAEGLET
jgi:hypothetical protein